MGCRCFAAFHKAWSLSIALRIVSSLRMHATMATFLGLPVAIKRPWKTLITGLRTGPMLIGLGEWKFTQMSE